MNSIFFRQATAYRDGRLDYFLEFVNGTLDRRARRPVYEAALTYETSTGVIEVVANARESRENFVRLFARELLGSEFREERVPWRRYDLQILLRPYDFPTDPQDGIESVRVSQLRLMPMDTVGERVTRGCVRDTSHTASERFVQRRLKAPASAIPRTSRRPAQLAARSEF
jgi:hypothetical protein